MAIVLHKESIECFVNGHDSIWLEVFTTITNPLHKYIGFEQEGQDLVYPLSHIDDLIYALERIKKEHTL